MWGVVMKVSYILCVFAGISMVSSCSSSSTTPSRRAPADKTQTSNGSGVSNGGDTSQVAPADCEAQWALVIKQQHTGSQFLYDTNVSVLGLLSKNARSVSITSASVQAITESTSLSGEAVSLYPSLGQPVSISFTKEKFMSTCQQSQPQTIAISALNGQVSVAPPVSQTLTLAGQQIPVQLYKMTLTNVKYAGIVVSGNVDVYISARYPALPLKQVLTITDSTTVPAGTMITDQLKSALPVSQ
jgi:hypothetical protein